MALEVLSNSGYYDTGTTVSKQKADTTAGLETNAAALNITELQNTTVAAGNQTGKDNTQNNGQKEGQATDQQIKNAISQANNQLKIHRTRCEFSYHEDTKRVSIKVVDRETEEVIREIPPEETLDMIEKMWELAGIIVDEKR